MDLSALMEDLKNDEALKNTKQNKKKSKRLICAIDAETDPFARENIFNNDTGELENIGRPPEPFVWGVMIENGEYYEFWGDDCTQQLIKFLKKYPHPLKMFAHNGGKFDFIFLLRMGILAGEPMIISSRLVECHILDGRHILRDSLAMMPIPLSAYNKDEIDYDKMERPVREENKAEILAYLKSDCFYLLELVQKFIKKFGDKITVGSAAISELKKLHPFEKIDMESDKMIRPYYKGGRVQFFEHGKVTGKLKVFDVNSMYPTVMADREHGTFEGAIYLNGNLTDSINRKTGQLNDFDDTPYFAVIKGRFTSKLGHFPIRTKAGLDFTQKEGIFEVTHHELICALKNNIFILDDVLSLIVCPNTINFKAFVDKFVADKIAAQKAGNVAETLFSKFMLNSSYGKFGQNPAKFKDYFIIEPWEVMEIEVRNSELIEKFLIDNKTLKETDIKDGYLWVESESTVDYTIFERRPDDISGAYNDCFVAASITGAARALLMDALIHCKRPIYCDTDSIICEGLGTNADLHPNRLGAWDIEAEGDEVYIYGKKVYAFYNDGKPYTDKKGKEKTANKGVNMNAEQIKNLVMGENLTWSKEKECLVHKWDAIAPSFKLSGETLFLSRELVYKNTTQKGCTL